MKNLLLVLVLIVPAYVCAQQSCPVQVTRAYTKGFNRDPFSQRLHTPGMKISYRNVSEKTIVGVQFGASYTDAVDNTAVSVESYTDDLKVKPNQSKTSEWDQYDKLHMARPNIHVLKVKFEDGTYWTDDGSHSCRYEPKKSVG